MESSLALGIALLLAPVLPGVILKVKALFAGKTGPPLLIRWYTLIKLLRKGSVYSDSTGFVFRLGPVAGCATALLALLFFPFAGLPPLLSFTGDIIVVLYALGLGRFCTVLAALDTASPFEGMGAAREVFFASLAEIGLFVVLILFHRMGGGLSLAGWFAGPQAISLAGTQGALLLLVVVALFLLLLAENSRVPVDDPATHLELTMIHEVMILDHSGPDLALIEFGAHCRLLFSACLVASLLRPTLAAGPLANGLVFVGLLVLVYAAVGVTESITARLRMNLVPKFILTSFALVFFAIILTMELV
ncbi:MAG: NADH-quinone oxidoreductase subunit H [Desulfobulbus sp.]|jgi:formate hydrogenlyase subunit 4|nr:NADH-quinone oxidoreductase subunit H [Desulfobulbus sp.]MBP8815555.1 NADH-quinone oxidoreductase subunit H [Desulfobulbus sp.]